MGLGISDTDGLAAMILDPLSRALDALQAEEGNVKTVGWRHREGAYMWRGKVKWACALAGSDGVQPEQHQQETRIFKASAQLQKDIASGESPLLIARLKSQLVDDLQSYARKTKEGTWNTRDKLVLLKRSPSTEDPTSKAPSNAPKGLKLRASLLSEIESLKKTVQIQRETLHHLLPYLSIHLGTIQKGSGLDSPDDSVQQSGVINVQAIMRGESPTCSICYCDVENPTFTRCGHLACRACMLKWLQAAPALAMRSSGANNAAGLKQAPCMMCRQPFSVNELIEVDANLDKFDDSEPLLNDNAAINLNPFEDRFLGISKNVVPFCAEDMTHFSKIFAEACEEENQPRIGMHLAYPSLPSSFLTALKVAAGIDPATTSRVSCPGSRSPKISGLLKILKQIKKRGEKCVIFSQQQESVNHVCHILREEKILHTRIIKADRETLQKAAVHTFMTQEVCLAIVLHAGAAAAGLTLTAAQNVILLEPFLKRGDELQAVARVHRIGQTRQTKVYVMHMKGKSAALIVTFALFSRYEQNSFFLNKFA